MVSVMVTMVVMMEEPVDVVRAAMVILVVVVAVIMLRTRAADLSDNCSQDNTFVIPPALRITPPSSLPPSTGDNTSLIPPSPCFSPSLLTTFLPPTSACASNMTRF